MFIEWVDDVLLFFGVCLLFQLCFCLYIFMDVLLEFHLLCFYLNGKFGCFNHPNDQEVFPSCFHQEFIEKRMYLLAKR
ncbi:hypothetical protein DsansV1_C10g0099291 [Dioscorea sansibarensis]